VRRLSILLLALVVGAFWLSACSRTEEDPLMAEAQAISQMNDPGELIAAARAFLKENPTADPKILGQVATDLLYALGEHRGNEAAIAAADSMVAEGLPDYVRASVEGFLTSNLLATGTPENLARAEQISRHLIQEDIDHPFGYTYMASAWLRTVESDEHDVDPWLPLDLALKGSEKAEDGWADYADMILGRAYQTVFGVVEERRGADAIPAVADSLLGVTQSADGAAHIRGALYDVTVEDDPEGAVAIAEAIQSDMAEMSGGDVLNSIAYDLAERDLAPGLAVSLAERALELTTGRWDSIYVLDTVGWAHHKAGNHDRAGSYLNQALDLMDEDPTYEDDTLQHLLVVYDAVGNLDGSIDLLVRVAARSLDPGAVEELERRLTARDGNADDLDRLLTENRYAGIEPAPGFTLPERSGDMVALADLGGRISLLCFWSYG
jgi:tetratricopeptide (TPR) repeat protein